MAKKAPERPEDDGPEAGSEDEAQEDEDAAQAVDEDEETAGGSEEGAKGEGAEAHAEASGQEAPLPKGAFEPKLLVEGVLFSAGHALQVVEIEQATGLARRDVLHALRRLASEYNRRNTTIEVAKVGGRWTMQLKEEVTPQARAVAPPEVPGRLLKTLALIAYHQPVRQSELMEMVGPRVYDQVKELADMGLVIAAPKGSTKVLTTTQRFLEYFGIANARRDYIKRFLADRVGIKLPEPQPAEAAAEGTAAAAALPASGDAPAECAPPEGAPAATPPTEEPKPPEAGGPEG
jgi:segregation and condensation protein B